MEASLPIDEPCPWPFPASIPPLSAEEVHVWCAKTDVADDLALSLRTVLSRDEQDRAARYLLDRPRRRFIACRAAQRLILAGYANPQVAGALAHNSSLRSNAPALRTSAGRLEFTYSPLGKPTLAAGFNSTGRLRFNISNSSSLALIAVTLDRELGVDVERIRDNLDHAGLAQRYFATEERDKLRLLSNPQQLSGFFDCWTRKEAFLKAIGKGLTYPLDRAVVSVGPTEPCRLLSLDGDELAAASWSLLALSPAPGYVAAIALPGGTPKVLTFRWDF